MYHSSFVDGAQLVLCRALLPGLAALIALAVGHEAFPPAILFCALFTLRACQFIPNQAQRQLAWAAATNLALYGGLVSVRHVRGLESVSAALALLGGLLVLVSSRSVLRILWLFQRTSQAQARYKLGRQWIAPSDWPSVFAVQRQVFPGLSLALAVSWALMRGSLLSVKLSGQVVAIAAVQPGVIPGLDWLALLAVVPDHRRSGYARQLLDQLGPALLTVHVENQAAITLYETSGFCAVERWRSYYGSGQDALLMARACKEQPLATVAQKGTNYG